MSISSKELPETEDLEKAIAELEDILGSDRKIKNIIISELKEVSKKYGQPKEKLSSVIRLISRR